MSVSNSERARVARAEALSRRRLDEARCAWEFMIHGDTRGAHADVCVYVEAARIRNRDGRVINEESARRRACSRDYDPGPPPENEKLYEGSALLTLWEDTPQSWQLAGWNVKRRNA